MPTRAAPPLITLLRVGAVHTPDGVGEIAISDHRSSQPTQDEIARLVSEARVGGMLAGKRGICHFHAGDGRGGLEPLRRPLSETEPPPTRSSRAM